LLNLGVKTANALVIEAKEIALFAADSERHGKIPEQPTFIDSVENLKRHVQIAAYGHPGCLHVEAFPQQKQRSPFYAGPLARSGPGAV
jgi:hypothetical protein